MQCVQALAATTRITRIMETIPHAPTDMPLAAVADWIESRGIAIEDVLDADAHTLRDQVAALVDRELRETLRSAA